MEYWKYGFELTIRNKYIGIFKTLREAIKVRNEILKGVCINGTIGYQQR